jgi:hypothetical protein
MQRLTERQRRQNVMRQFEMQLPKLAGYAIVRRLSNFRYILHDDVQERERNTMVLLSSWDYYESRLHRAKWPIDLLIVQRHNAVVPCSVLELATGVEHRPGKVPEIERNERKQRNHEESMLFVSKLIIGLDGVEHELSAMPKRTRQYYKALCEQFLRPRIGRPWAS